MPLFLYFIFYFYHAFIVLGYMKLCAVLAMEKTKPINQNKNTKETNYLSPPQSLKKTWLETIPQRSHMRKFT